MNDDQNSINYPEEQEDKDQGIIAAENSSPEVRDEDSPLGSAVSESGSNADELGDEAGLKPLEDRNGNPRQLGDEPIAVDDTDETEAEG